MGRIEPDRPARVAPSGPLRGLSSDEAAERLRRYGPNSVAEERPRRLLALLRKFWGPVPWMLEVAIVLEVLLREPVEGIIFAALLVLNAVLGFAQENRAQEALRLLKGRLAVQARVRRDGRWGLVPAEELVPGDVVHVRMGDLLPGDLRIVEGVLQVDQSALTGESLPVDAGAGTATFAGAVVVGGEATGEVTATGASTFFGRTAELVRTAKTPSHLEEVILGIVRYLVAVDVVLVVAILIYAVPAHIQLIRMLSFSLILVIASVPVALPATFTLATALGALDLAKRGVLVTRLSAIEEAAGMDVLCSDKTGTITENRLVLEEVSSYPPHAPDDPLRMAALASDESTQDPIDLAIFAACRERGVSTDEAQRLRYVPFDPATKRSEALVREGSQVLRAVKGAPQVVESLVRNAPPGLARDVEALSAKGARVLAVAAGPDGALELVGLVGLHDPPRPDSADLVRSIRDLGVRVVMVTGDGVTTARAVAAQVGLGTRACSAEALRGAADTGATDCDIYAEVLPEDKFRLVRSLQHGGHVVGMTGDGVNDAPALKQAEVGIAVASATDVAKAAASLVLTAPGLADIVAGVETSRRIYQRMLTYTLNKIIKTFQIALFLSLGLLLTGTFVTTPRLVVLLLFANDFVTMSIATDRVSFARHPDRWAVRPLVTSALGLAAPLLFLSFGVWWVGHATLGLGRAELQTMVFVWLVFSGQATVYLVRERRHFWSSLPSRWMLVSSTADVLIVCLLASGGWLMASVPPELIAGLLGLAVAYLVGGDALKVRFFGGGRPGGKNLPGGSGSPSGRSARATTS